MSSIFVYASYLGYPYSVVCPFPLNITSFPHRSSCIGTLPFIGATAPYMWGRWVFFSERVVRNGEGRGWEWDGGEVPVGGEAIRDKDTERGGGLNE